MTDRSAARTRDELLALRCQAGEAGAFGDLVAEFERPLLYFLLKLLGNEDRAYDALQELWLRVVRTIRQLVAPSALRVWLYRTAHGLAVDQIRHKEVRQAAELHHAFASDAAEPDPEFTTIDARAIHSALNELEPPQREVLVLFFLEGMSLDDISEVVGRPKGTVKSRLHYAKRALHHVLLRDGYGPS